MPDALRTPRPLESEVNDEIKTEEEFVHSVVQLNNTTQSSILSF